MIQSSKSYVRAALAVAAVSLVCAGPALAQANLHPVSGSVEDPRGNKVPKASVAIKNEAGKDLTRTTTDAQGHFETAPLGPGRYTVEAAGTGFGVKTFLLVLGSAPAPELTIGLSLGEATDTVTVEAANSGSQAAQYAPMDGLLEATSARTEISSQFIQNFTSPVSDYSEIIQMAPGTFSVNSNGVGLGDSKTYFRGFADGNYNITFDGIPWEDTNSPTHHSWAFFPSQWIGGVDFDRSPGSATSIGPTPYGGSINLLSKELQPDFNLRGSVSYGSYNTLLRDLQFDSGSFGGADKRSSLTADLHQMTSDGFQTYNAQQRIGGSLKYQFKLSEKTVLTGFSGVLFLDTNTPNVKGPTRLQALGNGTTFPGQYNYLLNTDPSSPLYVGYNYYHVPTDFEYGGIKSQLGRGWVIDGKAYTYQYHNGQNYAQGSTVSTAACALTKPTATMAAFTPCGIDKLNSYRKYGENTVASQTSKYGILRAGLWYEWATSDRYQTPQNVITRQTDALPNFHEQYWTNTYQPYIEYEWHPIAKLSVTGGFKYALYTMDLKQYADNGSTIGTPTAIGAAYIRNYGSFGSPLPTASANYRIRQNWSVYGQFATGSVIPPSSVFDVKVTKPGVPPVSKLPDPTLARTYQTGTVFKLKRVTLDADVYYTHFQNSYVSNPDPNSTNGQTLFQQGGDSISKGFEAEANFYLGHGVSFYGNGTAGSARYASATVPTPAALGSVPAGTVLANPNYNAWVANTPANTESLGLTYQTRVIDAGLFEKRVGAQWNDATSSGSVNGVAARTLNQIIPIAPFNITNLFLNYTIRSGGHFDNTKVRLSFNNLLDTRNIVGVTQAAKANTYTPGLGDNLSLTPGRSITLSLTLGVSKGR